MTPRQQLISANIKMALNAAKERGVVLGKHGKKVLSKTNKAAANEFANNMIPVIKSLQSEGYNNIRAIVGELNKRNIKTFRGTNNRWHIRTVNLLLKRIKPDAFKTKPHPVKWVGGKRSIIKELRDKIPSGFNDYYEPFFGGGALFFDISPLSRKAFLSDANRDLMTMYKIVKTKPLELIEMLKLHSARHNEEYYYNVRAKHNLKNPIEVAARMVYLNKTCFNGLWRVNSKGEFNASIGTYSSPQICNAANIKHCSKSLKAARLRQGDYLKIRPKRGDFVYFDPPYHQVSSTSFTAYSENDFTKKDHIRLAKFCKKLHGQGVKLMVSNSATNFIAKLYDAPIFNIYTIKAARMINSNPAARQPVEEFIITNY